MHIPNGHALGEYIRERREALGMSQRELSRQANIAGVRKIESGMTTHPRTDTLEAIARVLGVTITDLVTAGKPQELPNFAPYLRTKYGPLPEEAIQQIDRYFQRIAKRHGIAPNGPAPGEDES